MDPLTSLTFARIRIEDLRREAAEARRAAESRVAGTSAADAEAAAAADAAARRTAASRLFRAARTRMEALSAAGRMATPERCPVCLAPVSVGAAGGC